MNIIEAKGLTFSYADKLALDNLDIAIEKGKITAILGGNGAGKSTLFLNLNGLLKKSSGDIKFNGELVDYKKESLTLLRRKVGIVFQDPNDQLFSANVYKDISFGAINLGLPIDEVKRRVDKALEDVGMSYHADVAVHALSFGQKKRVAVAGVLVMQPEVIILDEITAGLDPRGVSEILHLLASLKDKMGITIILATHDIDIVSLYCDYVYVMEKGKVVMQGEPCKIFLEAEKLREYSLRLPRISHMMGILKNCDNLPVDESISTISKARKAINGLISNDRFSIKNGKKLRNGYTTGSCATAAAKASAIALFSGEFPRSVSILVPAGVTLNLTIIDGILSDNAASCSIIKDSGDDPDITNGIKITAVVSKIEKGIVIEGGQGIGTVTKRGLQLPVGSHAINPEPRKMITEALISIIENYQYKDGLKVVISAENGQEIAKRTFNERLGIIGGISILGTSGVVEPMSEKAIVDTIKLEIDSKLSTNNKELLLCLGNYGKGFAKDKYGVDLNVGVKCSNFIGEAIDYATYKGVENILLVGHSGKLVKLAGGVMNTHSKVADCRKEIFAAHAGVAFATQHQLQQIMQAITSSDIDALLNEFGISDVVWSSIIDSMLFHLDNRVQNKVKFELMIFTDKFDKVYATVGADSLIKRFKEV